MMTIEQMVKHFENRGFEVKKHWFKDTRSYQFIITKDDVGAIGMYEWKLNLSPEQLTSYQRNFIRRLIYLWEEQHDHCHNNKSLKDLEKQLLNSIYGITATRNTALENALSVAKGISDGLIMNPNYGRLSDSLIKYGETDIKSTKELWTKMNPYINIPTIKDVVFNDPATIVFWSDGTKTVVKCQGDEVYDPEKGLAMAISKKVLGNGYDYYNTFKKWEKKYKPTDKKETKSAKSKKNAKKE